MTTKQRVGYKPKGFATAQKFYERVLTAIERIKDDFERTENKLSDVDSDVELPWELDGLDELKEQIEEAKAGGRT